MQRFGGFVAKYMGDGVLVYFGYPQAHEDDAERAVRAGLELIQAVSAMKVASPLQTRAGIGSYHPGSDDGGEPRNGLQRRLADAHPTSAPPRRYP